MKPNNKQIFLLVSSREWHVKAFNEIKNTLPGEWHVITNKDKLSFEFLEKLNPKYIFFPHWSYFVSNKITNKFECICFHETNLPYGRGGSPIQNLIIENHENTKITALKMTEKLDAGPIYLQEDFSLLGLAEEIYIRSTKVIFGMIKKIITENPTPYEQKGDSVYFKRRSPESSLIKEDIQSIDKLFNFIRMLDAEGYPKAKIESNNFIFEFSRPALRINGIEASVKIKLKQI